MDRYEALENYRDLSAAVDKEKEKIKEAEERLRYLEDDKRKAWVVLQDMERQRARQQLWVSESNEVARNIKSASRGSK